jgi:hypothetical protein
MSGEASGPRGAARPARRRRATSPEASRRLRRALGGCLLAAPLAAACAAQPIGRTSFTDPFAYCAGVGTIDAPDARYTGPAAPERVARALRAELRAPADAPLELFTRGMYWRCMERAVYACVTGANLPCMARGDTSLVPSRPVALFCREHPDAEIVPAYVTGRATVYEWRCARGAPVAVRQVATPDARGFLSEIWHRVTPPPGNGPQ